MAVIRVNKTRDYTVMSNTHFKERDMTLKAKGLLSLMLSLPDDWDYSVAGLVSLSKDGKDSIMNALQELEELGYLTRTRATDEKGRFAGYDYDIYESPQTEKPYAGKPYAENPNTEKPNTENPPQYNTNISNTQKQNTKVSNTKRGGAKKFTPPTLQEVKDYCRERNNNVDAQRFIDHYTSNGWKVGKNAMKDWRAAVRTWERNEYSNGQSNGQSGGSFDTDDFFQAALRRSYGDQAEPKTAADDANIRERAERLKERLG